MTTPYPNGHKAWLESEADSGPETKRAICHSALYLGRILEILAWNTGYEAVSRRRPPSWWMDRHPHPEDMV